jgi:hypothetical protein
MGCRGEEGEKKGEERDGRENFLADWPKPPCLGFEGIITASDNCGYECS